MTEHKRTVETALITVANECGDEILSLYRTYDGAPDQQLGQELVWLFTHTELVDVVMGGDMQRSHDKQVLLCCGAMDFATDLVSILNGRRPYGQDCWPRLGALYVYPPMQRGIGEIWEYGLSVSPLLQLRLSVYCMGQPIWRGDAVNFNPNLSKWRDARAAYLEPTDATPDQASDRRERHESASDRGRHGDSSLSSVVLDFCGFRQARHPKA